MGGESSNVLHHCMTCSDCAVTKELVVIHLIMTSFHWPILFSLLYCVFSLSGLNDIAGIFRFGTTMPKNSVNPLSPLSIVSNILIL